MSVSKTDVREGESIEIAVKAKPTGFAVATAVELHIGDPNGRLADDADRELTFATGETSKTVTIETADDSDKHRDQKVNFNLHRPFTDHASESYTISGAAEVLVRDNDETDPEDLLPEMWVSDASAHEVNRVMVFGVSLDPEATTGVTVDYTTGDGTAKAGQDYTATSGTLEFNPGDRVQAIFVPIIDDTVRDTGETFIIKLSNVSGAKFRDDEATGTIHNSEEEAALPPLTASLTGMPSEHDSESFTFGLRFSEDVSRAPGLRGRFAGRELRRGMERDMGRNFLSRLESTAGAGARDTMGVQSDLSGSELLRTGLGGGDLLMLGVRVEPRDGRRRERVALEPRDGVAVQRPGRRAVARRRGPHDDVRRRLREGAADGGADALAPAGPGRLPGSRYRPGGLVGHGAPPLGGLPADGAGHALGRDRIREGLAELDFAPARQQVRSHVRALGAAYDVSQHGFRRLAVHAGFGHPDTNLRSETVQRRPGDTGQLEHPVSGFRGQRHAMLPAGFHSRRRDRHSTGTLPGRPRTQIGVNLDPSPISVSGQKTTSGSPPSSGICTIRRLPPSGSSAPTFCS